MRDSAVRRLILRTVCLVAVAVVASCGPRSEDENGAANTAAPVAENLSSLVPVPEPPFDRAGLLAAVVQAASATAAGADDTEAQRALDGRQFEIRIRFGCKGPSEELADDWLGWSLGNEGKTLRVRAAPTIAADDPLVRKIVGEAKFEAVEGFWIPRPWLLQAVCPAGQLPVAAEPTAPQTAENEAPQRQTASPEPAPKEKEATPLETAPSEPVPKWPRIGLAQFYLESDSRRGRRDGRAYEAVKPLGEGQTVGAEGFNLVLSGRLKANPGRKVIQCAAANPDSPPECLTSAEFDRVWIESPVSKNVIAEWTRG
jgi:hypothetical protein